MCKYSILLTATLLGIMIWWVIVFSFSMSISLWFMANRVPSLLVYSPLFRMLIPGFSFLFSLLLYQLLMIPVLQVLRFFLGELFS